MPTTKDIIRDSLATLRTPGLDTPLGDGLEWIAECDGFVSLKFHAPALDTPDSRASAARDARDAVAAALASADTPPVRSLIVEFVDHAGTVLQTERLGPGNPKPTNAKPQNAPPPSTKAAPDTRTPTAPTAPPTPNTQSPGHRPIAGLADTAGQPAHTDPLDSIKHIIAVGAGKGGVGKSTIAVNLAVGLARQGHAVGLLDGDIYGPSLPTMLALDALEQSVVAGKLQPHTVHGIKAITIGKLVEPDKPLIWRGPMAHGAFKQLVEQASWGELDYLIIDLPPGTGDVCLTMAQTLKLTGAVLVCTPQRVAQDDAIRAARMFQQLKIDILGVVENMSYFIGDDRKEYDIFGRGGAEIMAQRMGLPFLGALPINIPLRANSDSGNPTANFDPATAGGEALPQALQSLVTTLEGQVALASLRQGKAKPTLSIR
ncbi:MAG: Mrp/NBP35 family ATP-binding protein [Planctomycetota bacterium]|nr:Mrp/NBP35 family ATP-binding protein [Planctomycetota bacterium]